MDSSSSVCVLCVYVGPQSSAPSPAASSPPTRGCLTSPTPRTSRPTRALQPRQAPHRPNLAPSNIPQRRTDPRALARPPIAPGFWRPCGVRGQLHYHHRARPGQKPPRAFSTAQAETDDSFIRVSVAGAVAAVAGWQGASDAAPCGVRCTGVRGVLRPLGGGTGVQ